ncbi:MAG: flagellar assembly protein FliW [Rickettsiaceae bacterium]|nr:flagellar assembly protein FliW [Rickettsiaceae bacterium]
MARLKYIVEDKIYEVSTKLGNIKVSPSNTIFFPRGLCGIGDIKKYCLSNIPENKLPGALIMQSLEGEDLTFIVVPLSSYFYEGEHAVMDYTQIRLASEQYDIKEDNLSVLAISKISKIDDKFEISLNLKAPIFLDTSEKLAFQHVFIKYDYPIDYKISK